MSDPYAALARFYDLDHADLADDLDFWQNLAGWTGGPVLEIGAGSGRVLLPLARAGFDVIGLDTSPAMLARAMARLGAERRLARRVTLIEGDVRVLALPPETRPPLAIATNGVFGHLLDHADAAAALTCLRAALHEDGLLAIDLPNPLTLVDDAPDGLLFHDWTRTDPETGHSILRLHSRRTDPAAQRLDTTFIYDDIAPDGSLRRHLAPVTLRWYTLPELTLLLAAARFRVETVYGDWELGEYEAASPRLIVLARPTL